MKEETLIKILGICLIISVSCNIGAIFILNERLKESEWQSEMERLASCNIYLDEQSSYDRAFSEWDNFKCTFDNETLTLETECGGHGYTTITIFSHPIVNISMAHWDKYRTMEKWEEKDGKLWIKNTDDDITIISKESIFKEGGTKFFESINVSAPSWNFYVPASSWTQHVIDVQENISSNLTIVIRREISPFSYMDVICNFEPAIYMFEVKT